MRTAFLVASAFFFAAGDVGIAAREPLDFIGAVTVLADAENHAAGRDEGDGVEEAEEEGEAAHEGG